MAKLATAKKVGVPIPATMPDDVTHLVAYYGPRGFAPDYAQAARIEVPLAGIAKTADGKQFIFDTAQVPSMAGNELDLCFTLEDKNDSEEGDFNPVVTVPLDRTPPPRLGQAVVL